MLKITLYCIPVTSLCVRCLKQIFLRKFETGAAHTIILSNINCRFVSTKFGGRLDVTTLAQKTKQILKNI